MPDLRIGVISDTHGQLRAEVVARLVGVDRIIHAGDVGKAEVLDALRAIAPVDAVRGNVDAGSWARSLPVQLTVRAGEARIHVVHNLADLQADPHAQGWQAVVYGHSHRPALEWREGILFLNPGSIGPRRFDYPVALAILRVSGRNLQVDPIELDVNSHD